MYGGIDLGGTKIEACLHDSGFNALERRRIPTPSGYDALIDALGDQVEWLRHAAGDSDLRIGVGIPGLVDHTSGLAYTANLAAMNRPLAQDLFRRVGTLLPVENDCKCFALSEANGGAGEGAATVFGLIIGTGVGGGICIDGHLSRGWTGLPGEVGHIGIPAWLLDDLKLEPLACGCGRKGCYETYLSGPGIARISAAFNAAPATGETVAAGLAASDAGAERTIAAWSRLAGELIHTLQLTLDPERVVLGGGVTLIPGIADRILHAFASAKLAPTRTPSIALARFGDSSGVRGAAMLARPDHQPSRASS